MLIYLEASLCIECVTQSPTSSAVVVRQLRAGASPTFTLRDAFSLEYRLVQHLFQDHDVYEGVRAGSLSSAFPDSSITPTPLTGGPSGGPPGGTSGEGLAAPSPNGSISDQNPFQLQTPSISLM